MLRAATRLGTEHSHQHVESCLYSLVALPRVPVATSPRVLGGAALHTAAGAYEELRRAKRLSTFDPAGTVWAEFTPLAQKTEAVNLGQGFPNLPLPGFVEQSVVDAVKGSILSHQYSRVQGHTRLVQSLARHFSPKFGWDIDPLNEVVVTVGATNGIYAAFAGLLNPGDEVIIIEPFYDTYIPAIVMADGVAKAVPLRKVKSASGKSTSADWKLDMKELTAAITPKTRMLLVNTPHNPTGKVFTKQELEEIATVVRKHPRIIVLSDEVYSPIVYSDAPGPHVSIATLPGMRDRTITLGSVGKSFMVTGWKVGWAFGPKDLMQAMWLVTQYTQFCTPTPLQEALATMFDRAPLERYFEKLVAELQGKRDAIVERLAAAGLDPVVPHGSYFVLADTSKMPAKLPSKNELLKGVKGGAPFVNSGKPYKTIEEVKQGRDYEFCRWLTSQVGVAAIPPSAFYNPEHAHLAANFARFCFCKTDGMLEEAGKRLELLNKLTK